MGHILELQGELERRGARAVVILAQKRKAIREYLEENPYPLPVLADEKRQVSKDYGVYVKVNFESINIARPSTFVLDGEGIIRYIFVASIQTEYPPDGDILAALEER
jgi:peroxiredoxin